MEKLTLPVKGMHCAACSMTILKSIKKLEGIESCEVNYGNEKAVIEFDPKKVSVEKMNEKIIPLGYELMNKPKEHAVDHSKMDHSEHLGINQTKEDKIKELEDQKAKLEFVLPITFLIFFLMFWEVLDTTIYNFPNFLFPHDVFHAISLIISSIFLFWIGMPFLKEVVIFAKYKVANMYTLVGIGTLVAYVYSTLLFLFPSVKEFLNAPELLYFDVTIVVIGFIYLGRYLETRNKLKTGEAIEKLINLQAKTALVVREGKEVEIDVKEVVVSDIIIVKPGGKIPVDGVILEGASAIDEAMITGEPIPVDKSEGDAIIGGTINKHGSFKFRATKVGEEMLLSQIIKMVDDAQGSKAPIQKLADSISEVFVPAILILSVTVLFTWLVLGSVILGPTTALSLGILCFVGVLVIACPCALGLATPTAIIVGTGKAAENGILIKNAESLEKLHKVNVIVTDKTGTLTEGKPIVSQIISDDLSEKEFLEIIGSLENLSEHPIASAIIEKSKKENIEFKKVNNFRIIEGKGLQGEVNEQSYYAGNITLAKDLGIDINVGKINEFVKRGETPVILMNKKNVVGYVAIADKIKDNAKETVEQMHKLGIKVVMLTGDNREAAEYIASQIGIDKVIAEVLPNEKAEFIKQLQNDLIEGFPKDPIVAMIGDGINDAPSLAMADIGIAMGTGTDVAIESAEIILLKGDFSKVLKAIKLSKFTMNAIRQNLFWAFAYNIVGIPVAAGLLYPFFGIILNPALAGLAMAFSSVSVVGNSLRLKYKKI